MRNEERRNEAEVRRRNLLVTATEIEGDRQVHRQKLQDIGKNFVQDFYIYSFLCPYIFIVQYLMSSDT